MCLGRLGDRLSSSSWLLTPDGRPLAAVSSWHHPFRIKTLMSGRNEAQKILQRILKPQKPFRRQPNVVTDLSRWQLRAERWNGWMSFRSHYLFPVGHRQTPRPWRFPDAHVKKNYVVEVCGLAFCHGLSGCRRVPEVPCFAWARCAQSVWGGAICCVC